MGNGLADLSGKVAIITGGGRGQGAAEARLFASLGAQVVITDVLEGEGRQVAASIGDAARFVRHDVSSADVWADVVTFACNEFGRLDVLVNNAAICAVAPILDQSVDELEQMLRVNLVGPFLGIQAVVEPMKAAGGGSIINISSQARPRRKVPSRRAIGRPVALWRNRRLETTRCLVRPVSHHAALVTLTTCVCVCGAYRFVRL